MKPSVQLVMITSKAMNVSEETVVGCAIIYNKGKWRRHLTRDELDLEYKEYCDGCVSDLVTDFCLDWMSGRIPPNLLTNEINMLGSKAKTQQIKKQK
jgi:hypothetical protein